MLLQMLEHANGNYYKDLKKIIPAALLRQLVDMAFPYLEDDLKNHPYLQDEEDLVPGDVMDWRVSISIQIIIITLIIRIISLFLFTDALKVPKTSPSN